MSRIIIKSEKIKVNHIFTQEETLPILDTRGYQQLRLVTEEADINNVIEISARIKNSFTFEILTILIGSTKELLDITAYDELKIVCSTFGSNNNLVRFLASGF